MGAALDRTVTGWKAKPQVGRFYGDFLCMRSIRKTTFFPVKAQALPDFFLRSRAWRELSRAAAARKPLELLENSGGRESKISAGSGASESLSVCYGLGRRFRRGFDIGMAPCKFLFRS